jgi:hypothetical protein
MDVTLSIAMMQFAICAFLVVLAYGLVKARMLSNPDWLLGMGLGMAALATLLKAFPMVSQAVWQGVGREGLEVAAATVDPTLVALAGGLIASAFVLKVQALHASQLATLSAQKSSLEKIIEDEELMRARPDAEGEADRQKRYMQLWQHKREVEKELEKLTGKEPDL